MSMIKGFVSLPQTELDHLILNPDLIPSWVIENDGSERHLNIDKAWNGIHFLLMGNVWSDLPPLGNVICGGVEIGDDVGYGPVRYLTPKQVRQVARALNWKSDESLVKRYVPADMMAADIYPWMWDDGQEALDFLMTHYRNVVKFYVNTARCGSAVIHYVV